MTKVPRGEDPSAEVPRRSGGEEGGGGRRETGLQLSAVFNVRYILGTSLRKEAGNKLWSAVSA